jgi:hypothetical protein
MSDPTIPPISPEFPPPPGAIFELAERAVDFVRHAVRGQRGEMILDYKPETLPLLDHYLHGVPKDQPETIALIAAAAGAYFGEVARRVLGGAWVEGPEPPQEWTLAANSGLKFVPGDLAQAAILKDEAGAAFEVDDDDRAAVEEALEGKEVTEDEYYSLSGRLETFLLIADVLTTRRIPGIPIDRDEESADN